MHPNDTVIDPSRRDLRSMLNATNAVRQCVADLAAAASYGHYMDPYAVRSVVEDVGRLSGLPPCPYLPMVQNPDGSTRTPEHFAVYAWCAAVVMFLDFAIAIARAECNADESES